MWEKIPGKENYESSDSNEGVRMVGKKISLSRSIHNGYYRISFTIYKGKRINIREDKLIAYTFIPNPLNLSGVCHIDNDKLNNSASNLKWVKSIDKPVSEVLFISSDKELETKEIKEGKKETIKKNKEENEEIKNENEEIKECKKEIIKKNKEENEEIEEENEEIKNTYLLVDVYNNIDPNEKPFFDKTIKPTAKFTMYKDVIDDSRLKFIQDTYDEVLELTKQNKEIWRYVFNGYKVSNLGNVKTPYCKDIEPYLDNGYEKVSIYTKNERVHRLVAIAFIPNPKKLREVNHKNSIKRDNTVTNLEWCTRSENNLHAVYEGKNECAKPVIKMDDDLNELAEYPSIKMASRENDMIDNSGISVACNGGTLCGGFRWKFKGDDTYVKSEKINGCGINVYDLNNNLIKTFKTLAETEKFTGENVSAILNNRENVKKFIYERIGVKKTRKNKKCIYKFNMNGKLLETYDNAQTAAEKSGINIQSIYAVCNGGRQSSGGFKWSYNETL